MELGKHLRACRDAAELSQLELANRAGVHRVYVSLLERDERSPTVDVLERLCKAMGISVAELIAKAEGK